jgi:histidinol-phosphate aminotransferase
MTDDPRSKPIRVRTWVRPEIQGMSAYAVPHGAGLLKLDAMENPYPWPGALATAWWEILSTVAVNRYPDPTATELRAAIRAWLSLPEGVDCLLGNGSDELIQILLQAIGSPQHVVLAPEPTFSMYRIACTGLGRHYVGVPLLSPSFALDLPAMLSAIHTHYPALIFLAYPNNPTGNLFDLAALEQIIEAAPGLVVIDEAYAPFAESTCLPLIARYEQVVVVRTLSKMGLAGIRLGMLLGRPMWLAELNKVRLPYNINALTQATASFALGHRAVLDAQAAQIRADREGLRAALAALPGVTVWPSAANFLLFRSPVGADRIFAGLLGHKVLVRNLHGSHPALAECLRVSIGMPEENARFLAALQAALAALAA